MKNSPLQTLTIDEATDFLNQQQNTNLYKSSKKESLVFDLKSISHDRIINSDQQLLSIPIVTKNKEGYSRLLLLKVNKEIRSVVFNMQSEKKSNNGLFTGKMFMYSIDGTFVNGFRVKDDELITQFVKNNNSLKKNISSRTYGEDEGESLKEVIVYNRYRYTKSYSLELALFGWDYGDSNGGGYDESFMWASGGGGGVAEVNLIMPPPPEIPITDINKFLSCLNTLSNANLTVFAEKMYNGNGVGHAFISISQGNNTMVFGYYPKNGGLLSLTGSGIMGENGGHHFDVAANMGQISPQQLQQIIFAAIKYQNSYYDLSLNNCSDFATDVLNIAGVLTSGMIDTPNTVASILATLPNHTSVSNYAPNSKRTCP